MNYLITILSLAGFFAVFLTLLDMETSRRDARNKAAADALHRQREAALTHFYHRRR